MPSLEGMLRNMCTSVAAEVGCAKGVLRKSLNVCLRTFWRRNVHGPGVTLPPSGGRVGELGDVSCP